MQLSVAEADGQELAVPLAVIVPLILIKTRLVNTCWCQCNAKATL